MEEQFHAAIIAPRLTPVGHFPLLTKYMNESAAAAASEIESAAAVGRPWTQADLDVFVAKCEQQGLFSVVHQARQREDGEAWLPEDDGDQKVDESEEKKKQEQQSPSLKMTILEDMEEKFAVQVDNATVEFMNQLRRDAWSRLPSMAIETVIVIENNTIQSNDDWLAHRLGLLTLRVDPRLFDFYEPSPTAPAAAVQNTWTATTATTTPDQLLQQQQRTEQNTLVFSIDVQCLPRAGAPAVGTPAERFEHTELLGKDVQWHPVGNQLQRLQEQAQQAGIPFEPPHVVSPEVGGITRLGAGQRIHVIALAQKGTQSMHSHYGPVAAVRFHQQRNWRFSPAMVGDRARKLVAACPKKVFELTDVEDLASKGVIGVRVAEGGALRCNLCRECTTRPEFAGQVDLRFSRSSFVFTLESNGAMRASEYWKMLLEMHITDERQRRQSNSSSSLGAA